MITYTISSNFCKKRFSASIPPGYFYCRSLFYFISTENETKKGNTLMELKYLLFKDRL